MKYLLLMISALFIGLHTANAQKSQISFRETFAKARKELGANGIFEWNNKLYTTEYAEEIEEKHHITTNTAFWKCQKTSNQLFTLNDSISYAVGVDISSNAVEANLNLKSQNARASDISVIIQAMNDVLNNNRQGMHYDASYSVGIFIGDHIVKVNDYMEKLNLKTLDPLMVAHAIKDALNNRQSLTRTEARDFLIKWSTKAYTEFSKYNLQESEHYIDSIRQNDPEIRTTQSGLLYEIKELGDRNIKVRSDWDKVVIAFNGNLKDGTKLISDGDIVTCQINQIIAGWAEGIKLIGKGGKIRLIIHPNLANGVENIDRIPPNSVLSFEIELIDVISESPFRLFIKKIKKLFGCIDKMSIKF